MPYVKVMIHAVWGTKNREHYLTPDVRYNVIQHIKENARSKQIYIDEINGYTEHLHCLFGLNSDISIAKVIQLIKGESAHWINKNGIVKPKFEWADEYFAASVSESVLDKVRTYIKNQEEHHKTLTFTQEYNKFITEYRFRAHG